MKKAPSEPRPEILGAGPAEAPAPPRRLAAWLLGVAISALFFYLAARDVDWHQLWQAIPGFNEPAGLLFVFFACVLTILRMPARAARWGLLVRPLALQGGGHVTFRRLFTVVTIGTALDNLLPARAGDFARAGLLRRDGLKASSAFATIVVERIIDVAATQILILLALLVVPLPPWLWRLGLVTLAIATGAVLAMAAAVKWRSTFEGLVQKFTSLLPSFFPSGLIEKIEGLAEAFLDGFEAAARTGHLGAHLAGLLGWSLVVHATNILPVWCVLIACDLGSALAPAIVVTTFMAFAVMLPAAPGQVGTIHFAAVSALALFGIEQAPALAFALLFHASQYLPVTLLGVILLWREGLRAGGDSVQ